MKARFLYIGVVCCFLKSIAVPVLAYDLEEELLELYGDDETVSISTGTNKPIRLAPSVASVITQEDIEILGVSTLDEVLESVPGLHVSVSKTNKLNTIYSIRGIHTARNAQVLLLIDGLPIRQLYGGGRPSNFLLPVENIKRVEVVRGPGSAVYGADAFAGVINVITKGAAEIDGLELGAKFGTFDSIQASAQFGKIFSNDWQLALSIEHAVSDGDSSRVINSDLQSIFDSIPFIATNASLAPGPLQTEYSITNFRLGLRNEHWDLAWHSWTQTDAGLGQGGAQALDPEGWVDAEYHSIAATYRGSVSENLSFQVNAWASVYDEDNFTILFPAGARIPIDQTGNVSLSGNLVLFPDGVIGTPGGKENRYSLEASATYKGNEKHEIRIATGIELQRGEVREAKNFGPGVLDGSESIVNGQLTDVTDTEFAYADIDNREIHYLSVQDSWVIAKDWEATIGVRYDNYSDFGSTLNPRAALVWATSYNLTSKLLYGRAFRAPSFAELFAINNPVILGNAELKPETIDTVELAFDYRFNPEVATKLNFFWYEIEDAIDFIAAPAGSELPAGSSVASNASTQEGLGFELELEWQLTNDVNLKSNYSRQFAESGETGQRIEDAPGSQWYLSMNIDLPSSWHLNFSANWINDRRRNVSDPRSQIRDYSQVDLALFKRNFMKGLDLTLSVNNLFDERAEEPSASGAVVAIPGDLPMERRSISFGVEYNFPLSRP